MNESVTIPTPKKGDRICVVGAGFMGCVIATIYAHYGYQVVINDADAATAESYAERARPIVATFTEDAAEAAAILGRVSVEPLLEKAVEGVFLAHEVVQEVIEVKQAVFEQLDQLCPDRVILGTNTSSLLLSQVAARVNKRERVLGIHYVTPAHIVRVVELIHADFTPDHLVDWGRRFLATIDHVGVACAERPGFLVNRIQFAMLSEIYRLVDEGLASREDIDSAVRLSLGPRLALWGPLLTEDLVVSKATALAVTDSLYQQTGDENFKGRDALRRLVAEGRQGALTGQGWYTFRNDYGRVVEERDAQLSKLLDWLRALDPVRRMNVG